MLLSKGVNLEAALLARRDNFLPLRHLAALLVIYGHSYSLSTHAPETVDWIARLMPGFYAGNFAVYVFFAISGYLVTVGLLRKPGFWRYVRHRFLRVYPAYLVCLLLTACVLGPMFTSLTIANYFHDRQTWQYLLTNLSPIKLAWELPGVFTGNPYPRIVNGTLWSLGLEVRWYAYLAVLAIFGIVRRRWAFTIVAAAFLAFAAWEWWIGRPDPLSFRSLSMVFMAAALAAQWRDRLWIRHWQMLALLLLCVFAHGSAWFGLAAVTAISYASFWFAYALPVLPWKPERDYSYGLFLYGFPAQQAIVASFPGIGPLQLFFFAAVTALMLAAASWHFVEKPALAFKR
jgi:peptidoglycan/LPS O-acetylase OafA/YrhL